GSATRWRRSDRSPPLADRQRRQRSVSWAGVGADPETPPATQRNGLGRRERGTGGGPVAGKILGIRGALSGGAKQAALVRALGAAGRASRNEQVVGSIPTGGSGRDFNSNRSNGSVGLPGGLMEGLGPLACACSAASDSPSARSFTSSCTRPPPTGV